MIKEEEVEDVDGSYACVICSESVRGMAALCCARCSSNPFHASCVDGTGFAEMCPQCAGKTVVAWTGRDAGSAAAAAAAIVIEDAPRDHAPAATPPKEGAFLFSSPSGCCSSLRPDRVRARGADVATPVATPQTAAPTGNIFARKSSQGINTGPRSCAFCSRTFCSQHALDIHLSRNMVPRFDVHARACACTCLLAACASCDRDLTPGLLRRSAAPCTGSP